MDFDPPQSWTKLFPLLFGVALSWRRTANQKLDEHGLSSTMAVPIVMLIRQGTPIRQSDLADLLGVERPSIVRVLDSLEADGLVERHSDPTDRRARLLKVTKKGKRLGIKIEAVLKEARASYLRGADPADVDATLRFLTYLARQLGSPTLQEGEGDV